MRLLPFVLVVISLAGTASAQGYREPQRSWFSGFGQGILEAAVRNSDGAELRFACLAGAENVAPSITLTLESGGPVVGAENLNAVFEIDGVGHEWSFHRKLSRENGVEYHFEAFNWRVELDQQRLASALRRGRTVVVFVPADRVMQEFSLSGSHEALAGCAGE